jgi:CBS domain-containing protein
MSPSTFVAHALREVPLLRADQDVGTAAATVIATDVPALPVIGEGERYVGVFGEREFIHAVFPPYFDTLGHAGFVPQSLDRALERGAAAATEAVSKHMTTDHVEVGPEASDAEIAEIFLHHRVLVVPVVDGGRVAGIVTRNEFFRTLAEKLRQLNA